MYRCQGRTALLLRQGVLALMCKEQSSVLPCTYKRGYHRHQNKDLFRSRPKVGKHWNCRNARDNSVKMIHARNAGLEGQNDTRISDRLFAESDDEGGSTFTDGVESTKTFKRPPRNSPPEVNLLTWAAKEQLRFLHNSDPSEWTPERLAECFPISIDGVKKLLRSKFTMNSPAKICAHDLNVLKKWKAVCSGSGGPLSAEAIKSTQGRPLLLEHAAGNSNLPMPLLNLKPMPNGPSSSVTSNIGYFESLICNEETKALTLNADVGNEPLESNIVTTEQLETSRRDSSKIMTAKQFMENLLEEFDKKKLPKVSDKAQQYQEWVTNQIAKMNITYQPQPTDHVEPQHTLVKEKYRSLQQPPLRWDMRHTQKQPEAYIYTNRDGYQQPCGKADDEPKKVTIPRHQRRPGQLYKKGDSFYSEDGDFLYRVPGLK